jgi:hypothetical protein
MKVLIRGCQRCGSGDLRMAGLADGVMVGEGQDLAKWACDRCGLAAVPLLFDDEQARLAYEKARGKDPAKDWPESGWPSLKKPFR